MYYLIQSSDILSHRFSQRCDGVEVVIPVLLMFQVIWEAQTRCDLSSVTKEVTELDLERGLLQTKPQLSHSGASGGGLLVHVQVPWGFVRGAEAIRSWEQRGMLSIWETREGTHTQKRRWKGHRDQPRVVWGFVLNPLSSPWPQILLPWKPAAWIKKSWLTERLKASPSPVWAGTRMGAYTSSSKSTLIIEEKSFLQPCPGFPSNSFSSLVKRKEGRGVVIYLWVLSFFLSTRLYKESPVQESLQKKHLSGTQCLLEASLNFCHSVSTSPRSSLFLPLGLSPWIYGGRSWKTST